MPTLRSYPPPQLGRVAWPPDRGLWRTLVVSAVGHVLLVLLFFFYLQDWMPGKTLAPVYRVEVVGLRELAPPVELPQEPVISEPVKLPPVLPKSPPPVAALAPPPKPAPVAAIQPPPPRELPQPQSMPKKLTQPPPTTASALPDAPALVRPTRDPELNVPDRATPVARPRVASAPMLDDNRPLVTARNNTEVSSAPSMDRSFQSRAAAVAPALPDSNSTVLPSAARNAAIAAPELNARRPTSPRSNAADALPGTATPVSVSSRAEQNFAAPRVASAAKPTRAPAAVAMAPTESGYVPPRPTGADPMIPTNVEVRGTTLPTARRPEPSASPRNETPGLAPTRSGAQIDRNSLSNYYGLKTCLNTDEETQLKIRLATRLEGNSTCQGAGGTLFSFSARGSAQGLDVGMAPGPGVVFRDRCEALRAAVKCVEQKP